MVALVPEILDDGEMPPDAQRGFHLYYLTTTEGGQRSPSRTAQLLEIPIGTVKSWASRYRWADRAKALDRENNLTSWERLQSLAAAGRVETYLAHYEIAHGKDEKGRYLYMTDHRQASLRALERMQGFDAVTFAPPAAAEPGDDTGIPGYSQADLNRLAESGSPEDLATLKRLVRGQQVRP